MIFMTFCIHLTVQRNVVSIFCCVLCIKRFIIQKDDTLEEKKLFIKISFMARNKDL